MTAAQLTAWHEGKLAGRNRAAFVPALTIGSMPKGQGSAVSLVNDHPGDLINDNAVPYVPGGYPHHIAAPGWPGTQQQTLQPQMTVPPWIAVPICKTKTVPQPARIGLTGEGSALNLPSARAANVRRVIFTTT
jgi:hypothetical protein